jgi:hypothetical protein
LRTQFAAAQKIALSDHADKFAFFIEHWQSADASHDLLAPYQSPAADFGAIARRQEKSPSIPSSDRGIKGRD